MGAIKESLTFDDVLLIPQYSSVLPSDTNISLDLTKNISLQVPFCHLRWILLPSLKWL